MKKSITRIALCLIAALLAGCGSAGNQEFGSDPTGHDLRIMSFNIRYGAADDGDDSWPLRRGLVTETVLDFAPHLLGVQECLGFQAEVLRGVLAGHGFVGVGRDDGGNKGEMCGIFYDRRRFELLDSGHFWLSPTPDTVGSVGWDAALTRMASWVKLRSKNAPRQTFVFCNTHFDHVGQQARRRSAGVIHRRLQAVAGDLPVILCGDFNAAADPTAGGPYQVLREGGWQDSYAGPSENSGTFNGFRGETAGPRIDWILTRGGWRTEKGGIVRHHRAGRYPSDHFPVTAVLGLPERN